MYVIPCGGMFVAHSLLTSQTTKAPRQHILVRARPRVLEFAITNGTFDQMRATRT